MNEPKRFSWAWHIFYILWMTPFVLGVAYLMLSIVWRVFVALTGG
jgi:hypothetical protein